MKFLPVRWSPRSSKQLLWLWLEEDMRGLKGGLGLDAACGFMENRRFFKTDRYLGIDINADRIEAGLRKYLDAEAKVARIEELDESYAADVVLCVQTIGTHAAFSNDKALTAVQNLIAATREGGTLIVNIGLKCVHDGIEDLLRSSFENVDARYYGRKSRILIQPLPLITAHIFKYFPKFRGNSKVYFVCTNRKNMLTHTERAPVQLQDTHSKCLPESCARD